MGGGRGDHRPPCGCKPARLDLGLMEGPPDSTFKPSPQAYADRIASERIGLAGTHQLDGKLAECLREMRIDVDPGDVSDT